MQDIREDLAATIQVPWLSTRVTATYVLRLDKIHPVISGNKWYKLRYYLEDAKSRNTKNIITFGGAYSNHILATAAACNLYGLRSIGIIRGEEPKKYSPTLKDAGELGMEFHFTSRTDYAEKMVPAALATSENYIIPEGGYGAAGARGAKDIPYRDNFFNGVCCATGTGTMMAGLINKNSSLTKIFGFSVLKNHTDLDKDIGKLLHNTDRFGHATNNDYHFGGYAKYNAELIDFMNKLYENTAIPTDFVYTGKLFYGVKTLLEDGFFNSIKKLLVIHSGGLQGNRSLPKGTLIF